MSEEIQEQPQQEISIPSEILIESYRQQVREYADVNAQLRAYISYIQREFEALQNELKE